jgi:hypothetical protein
MVGGVPLWPLEHIFRSGISGWGDDKGVNSSDVFYSDVYCTGTGLCVPGRHARRQGAGRLGKSATGAILVLLLLLALSSFPQGIIGSDVSSFKAIASAAEPTLIRYSQVHRYVCIPSPELRRRMPEPRDNRHGELR